MGVTPLDTNMRCTFHNSAFIKMATNSLAKATWGHLKISELSTSFNEGRWHELLVTVEYRLCDGLDYMGCIFHEHVVQISSCWSRYLRLMFVQCLSFKHVNATGCISREKLLFQVGSEFNGFLLLYE